MNSEMFEVEATTALPATQMKKTSRCFRDPVYRSRDDAYDRWPPEMQEARGKTIVTSLSLKKSGVLFEGWARGLLDMPMNASTEAARSWMQKHTLALPQMEELVRLAIKGEETGLVTVNNHFNLFFTPCLEVEGSIAVGCIYYFEKQAICALLRRFTDTTRLTGKGLRLHVADIGE